MHEKNITVIGPTASGKSDLAITIAKKYSGEVISADSRQIHRHLDIGTGKETGFLTISEKRGPHTKKAYMINGIPHYMIDIVQPNTEYNVAKFIKKARKIKNDITSKEKIPIICGGTMFWAQALIEENDFPPVLPKKKLRKELSNYSKDELFKKLKTLDPIYAKKVDRDNPVRLIRAIEIATELGSVPEVTKKPINPNEHLIIVIMHQKEILHDRIEKRMDTWFERGIFDEIHKAHFDHKMPWSRLEGFGLEYKWCTRYVRSQITYDEMRMNTIKDLKQYAKRQITWIRRWKKQGAPIHDVATQREALILVERFLKES